MSIIIYSLDLASFAFFSYFLVFKVSLWRTPDRRLRPQARFLPEGDKLTVNEHTPTTVPVGIKPSASRSNTASSGQVVVAKRKLKVFPQQETEELGAPLLRSEGEVEDFSDLLLTSNRRMETSHHPDNTMNLSTGPMAIPGIRRTVFWAIGIRTLADVLPAPMQLVVNSGKMSAIVFVGAYLLLIALWLPFWLLSFFVTEWGVYFLVVGAVFLIGRGIIRMIAFPGSSNRVASEIEKEFSKYSIKMIINSANSLIDLASAISSVGPRDESPATFYEIAQHWKRCKSYRDRVLAVYADVLSYILNAGQQTSHSTAPHLTKYGNNRLTGEIGDLSGLTLEARADGKLLLDKLTRVLAEMEKLEAQAKPMLENIPEQVRQISTSVQMTSNSMGIVAAELRDFVESLKPTPSMSEYPSESDDEGDVSMDDVRRRFEEQSGSVMDSIKTGISSILPMLDPPLHTSIFGFDVQRGCTLSRYVGARQLWVQRQDGGMIDVIHIPARTNSISPQRSKKAVLYCNPNAGLIEVATGMSLAGGNVEQEGLVNENCWADFYTNLGFDVYLFNYAGFGRSYGAGYCGIGKRGGEEPYVDGIIGRVRRICHATVCGFQPTPDTLRADGLVVAWHILTNLGVDSLVIHGESIGGVAASATARQLSQSPSRDKLALLICDRTFCNLESVAQRLVGSWSGYAIRLLAPLWSTDVAGDFIAASCPKVVANDSADSIIFDSASLKAGIAFWKEIHRSAGSTKSVGWMMEAPLQYRMAVDYENVPVHASRFFKSLPRLTPPVWPADKHISLDEAFHFAACVKRIGKIASIEKKRYVATDVEASQDVGECPSPIFQAWKYLGTCEGLCGAALGMAVRGGYDVTVSWLCSTLTFGGQTVVEGMEHRHQWTDEQARSSLNRLGPVNSADFDCRPPDYESQESDTVVHPKPIPEVLERLRKIVEENANDETLLAVSQELAFVIDTLQYVVTRLCAPMIVENNWKDRHLQSIGQGTIGSFLNLHCGHNNPFSVGEKKRLRVLLQQSTERGEK